jgi:hypothetical protein
VEGAGSFSAGLQTMHFARWDVVVVAPTVQHEGDGVRFVRSFKRTDAALLPAAVANIVPLYQRVPFVISPIPGTGEYAIFETSTKWSIAEAEQTPLTYAILRLKPSA